MLIKTSNSPLPPRPTVEGTVSRLDPCPHGGLPTGFILTGWSDGIVDANVLAPTAKLVLTSGQPVRQMSPLQKRMARIVRYDPDRKTKKEIAEFLDKINAKTRAARERS